jgi:dipeptidyl-peptidase-4
MRVRALFLAVFCAATLLPAEERNPVTVEWIFSDECEETTRLPEFAWTGGGDILLLDTRRPETERTFELLDIGRGRRRTIVDRDVALAGLKSLLGDADAPAALSWPDSLDRAGRKALYLFGGDVFVLDLVASRFDRLTRTPDKEVAARLSPDGNRAAFVRRNNLYVLDLASGAEIALTRDGSATVLNGTLSGVYWEESFDHEDAGYWWSPDSTAIAFLRSDESAVSVVTFSDFTPPVPNIIEQRYPKPGGVNPTVRLGIVDVRGGRTAWLDPSAAPYEYILGVEWLPDSRRVAVQVTNRAQTRLDLLVVGRSDAEAKRVLTETDDAWVTQHDVTFLEGGARFLWTSERDGFTHLYLFSADGSLISRLTRGEWSVRGPGSFFGAPLDSSWVDEAQGLVYFTALERSPAERHLYRVRLDGTGFERISRAGGIHRPHFSPDRRFYLDAHSSHAGPPSLLLRAADGTERVVVAPPRTDLVDGLELAGPEFTTIAAADGFAMPARIVRPNGFDRSRRYPVILYVYGGPSAPMVRDAWPDETGYFEQVLVREGYVVVQVDNRSATGISKRLENPVVRRVWSDGELTDLVAAVRWLKSQAWVDPERVGVWGWSGGGTFTLLAMTRSQEFKAGIAVAPLTDFRYYDTKFAETYMKTPADNPDGYEYTSLVRRAKDLRGRVLLVHGTHDDNVHPQSTLAFADELIKAGKQFDMMMYPMRKHTIDDRPARIHLFNKMLEFWKLYL